MCYRKKSSTSFHSAAREVQHDHTHKSGICIAYTGVKSRGIGGIIELIPQGAVRVKQLGVRGDSRLRVQALRPRCVSDGTGIRLR